VCAQEVQRLQTMIAEIKLEHNKAIWKDKKTFEMMDNISRLEVVNQQLNKHISVRWLLS
jgi:hypothetical protein